MEACPFGLVKYWYYEIQMMNKEKRCQKRKKYEHQATCTESDNNTTTNKETKTRKNRWWTKKTYVIKIRSSWKSMLLHILKAKGKKREKRVPNPNDVVNKKFHMTSKTKTSDRWCVHCVEAWTDKNRGYSEAQWYLKTGRRDDSSR